MHLLLFSPRGAAAGYSWAISTQLVPGVFKAPGVSYIGTVGVSLGF